VYQVRDRVQETGARSSFQIGGHRRSRIAGLESEVRFWIKAEPDLSLAEICDRLAERGVSVKVGALWHQLNKWNLTFKKNASRQRARSAGRAVGTQGVAGSAAHDGRRKARIHR
jgi:transposase